MAGQTMLRIVLASAVCAMLAQASPAPDVARPSAADHVDLLRRYQSAEREVLRTRADPQRHRLWVLTPATVYVYDTAARTLLRRVALPVWSIADFDQACPPDLALDRRGSAFISSNVEPKLFEIDGTRFSTRLHALEIVPHRQRETGFGALRFAADGSLHALGAVGRSVYRIDLANEAAVEVEPKSQALAIAAGACARDAL